ncbi:transporter substrate-binding domain-containing protein [Papillibacter cinnamivorans]|uniref:Amino acid ABC transporter substrate-binding protein, PAAT family n=1 Tax=Papillibacter cinnamivorans DSM 12816 TaxID=1122930 RepID=A0A1W2BU08_9FIRM|nr:transporter substrate-binding domain-containing protein [Papillibacter cinnamivorans]SMC76082.1 amino acid ABC transporter substrate-binding protein, PAAT family [Papillibacter cinnamivorans DSM 12816]
MKKKLRILLAASVMAAMLLPITACSGGSSAATATPTAAPTESAAPTEALNGTLRVGMECAYAPFNWTQTDDSNGAVPIDGSIGYAAGYDVEIAKLVAASLNKELVVVQVDWEGLEPALNSGKIDAIIAGMSPTADRRLSMDFSDYYYDSDLVVVVRADSKYVDAKSIGDFAGAKITAQQNTFHYTVLDQMDGIDKQTAMADFPTMIVALTSGKIDGYISERPAAIAAVNSNPEITYVAFEEGKGFDYTKDDVAVSVAIKKGSDLLGPINEALAGITAEDRQALMESAIANQPSAS